MVVASRKGQTDLPLALASGRDGEHDKRAISKSARVVVARTTIVIIIVGLLWEMPKCLLGNEVSCATKQQPSEQDVSVSKLMELENRFGGFVRNVPRQVVSKHDPRPKASIEKGGMTGGDRMSYDNHNYGVIYESILHSLPTPVTAVAEIGILKGSGLAIWSELFPNAKIHGFDINLLNVNENMDFLKSRGAFASNKLELHEFDQFEPVIPTKEMFQFIIDDGFHSEETVQRTFEAFAPWLQQGGTYVVEDCTCHNFRTYMKGKKDKFSTVYMQTNPNSDLIVITHRQT